MAEEPISQVQTCTKCKLTLSIEAFSPRRGRKMSRQSWCRTCINAHKRATFPKIAEKRRLQIDAWAKANPEKRLATVRQWAARNAERERERSKRRYRDDPDMINRSLRKRMSPDELAAHGKAWRASKKEIVKRATPPWADRKAIREVYRQAAELERTTGVPHHVDHIFPLRSAYLCGLHYHLNLRAIPAEENLRKTNRLEFEADGSAKPFS